MITYPVSETDRFVVYNTETNEVFTKKDSTEPRIISWTRLNGQPLEGLEWNIRPALVVMLPVPGFDSATHKVGAPIRTLIPEQEEYHIQPTIVALTQQELDLIALQQELAQKGLDLRNAIATLRDWATQAQGVTVTSGNAVTVLQSVVDKQVIFYDKFADLIETTGGVGPP